MCRQISFRIVDEGLKISDATLGGIGIYNDTGDTLINVICECCGAMFEPNEVEVLTVYGGWRNLNKAVTAHRVNDIVVW